MKQQDKLRLFKLSEMDTADSIKEFEKSGCVQISDFLPVEKVSQLASAIEDMSEARENSSGSITVGDKRIMFPLPVSGAFNDPDLFASPSLWSFFEATLGKGVCFELLYLCYFLPRCKETASTSVTTKDCSETRLIIWHPALP